MHILYGMRPLENVTIRPSGLLSLYLGMTDCMHDDGPNHHEHASTKLRERERSAGGVIRDGVEALWVPDHVDFECSRAQPYERTELVIFPQYRSTSPFMLDDRYRTVIYSTGAPWLAWYPASHSFKGLVPQVSELGQGIEQRRSSSGKASSYPIQIHVTAAVFSRPSQVGPLLIPYVKRTIHARLRLEFSDHTIPYQPKLLSDQEASSIRIAAGEVTAGKFARAADSSMSKRGRIHSLLSAKLSALSRCYSGAQIDCLEIGRYL